MLPSPTSLTMDLLVCQVGHLTLAVDDVVLLGYVDCCKYVSDDQLDCLRGHLLGSSIFIDILLRTQPTSSDETVPDLLDPSEYLSDDFQRVYVPLFDSVVEVVDGFLRASLSIHVPALKSSLPVSLEAGAVFGRIGLKLGWESEVIFIRNAESVLGTFVSMPSSSCLQYFIFEV